MFDKQNRNRRRFCRVQETPENSGSASVVSTSSIFKKFGVVFGIFPGVIQEE